MVSSMVLIDKDASAVWDTIESEFCKTFKCKANSLEGKAIKIKTRNYVGNTIDVQQKITEYVPGEIIAMLSVNDNDHVTTTYKLKPVAELVTKVILSVEGKNSESVLKSWNYFLMGLPILRGGTKKKLQLQLTRLKVAIENKGD